MSQRPLWAPPGSRHRSIRTHDFPHALLTLTSTSFTLVLSTILFLLVAQAAATPTPADPHARPGLWADLLRADRFTFLRRPSPPLFASEHFVPAGNTSVPPAPDVYPSSRGLLSARSGATVSFSATGPGCAVRVTVVHPPRGLRVDPAARELARVLAHAWRSSVTLTVRLAFRPLGPPTALAHGEGIAFVRVGDTIVPVAAAEAMRGRDLNADRRGDEAFDVLVTLNSRTPWHVGPPGRIRSSHEYDLVTVALQECYHSLVFAGSVVVKHAGGRYGQKATLFRDYRTRFDAFLATHDGCAVLDYLHADVEPDHSGDSGHVRLTKSELLAAAVCNDKLYWCAGGQRIAKLHAPPAFVPRTSIYHLDPHDSAMRGNECMFPDLSAGLVARRVGPVVLDIQRHILDTKFHGARRHCKLPHPGHPRPHQPEKHKPHNREWVGKRPRVIIVAIGGGFPVWAIVLIVLLALLLLLCLGWCCLYFLWKKRKRSKTEGGGGGRSTSYYSSHCKHSSSGRCTSKDKKCCKKKKPCDKSKGHTTTECDDDETCPSSGKRTRACCCKVCTPVAPPPPVGVCKPVCDRRSSSSHHHHHHHHHHEHRHKKCNSCRQRRCKCKSRSTSVAGVSVSFGQSVNKTIVKSFKGNSSRNDNRHGGGSHRGRDGVNFVDAGEASGRRESKDRRSSRSDGGRSRATSRQPPPSTKPPQTDKSFKKDKK